MREHRDHLALVTGSGPAGAVDGPYMERIDLAPVGSGLTALARGEGSEVVCVHGMLGDYRQWLPIAARLEDRYRVVAISRRHHWPNPAPSPDAPYSYESHRDDLLALLRAVGHPVHLVGHSYGAGVVLLAALREPEWIRSLALIEPAFVSLLPEEAPGLADELAGRAVMVKNVQRLVREGQDARAAEVLIDWTQGGAGGFAELPEDVRGHLLANVRTIGPSFAVPAPQVSCGELGALRVPALVVRGEDTRLFYRLVAETAASCLPGAAIEVVPGARHLSIVEKPEEMAALLRSFLARRVDLIDAE